MNQESYRKLISGQKTGPVAALLRLLLGVASAGYSTAIRLRNFLYSAGWLKVHRTGAAVISIGNITTGGTGKTPLVIWLCKRIISDSRSQISNFKFQISDLQCAILTRGYKARRASYVMRDAKNKDNTQYAIRNTEIDEPAIFAESCPEVKVIVNPDRVGGAAEAVSRFGTKVLIMDDGFQHRRLARDLDIITIDAALPFGYGRILPAGLLREPAASLKRAGAIVITRCDQITENELSELEERLRRINPDMVIARSIHAPAYLKYPEPPVIPTKGEIQENSESMDSCSPLSRRDKFRRNDSIEQLKGKKIFAFCGIGNPGSFLTTIKSAGAELVGSKIFNDHHHYTDDCIADIFEQAERLKSDLILTTQKDWTKTISDFRFQISEESSLPVAYIGIEIKFLSGEEKLMGLIEETLAGKIPKM